MKTRANYSLTLALVLCCSALAYAQEFRVESQNPPPARPTSAETFTSLEGRFSIALPRQIAGFRSITLNTPNGRVTAGDAYSWRLQGAQYEVGYVDRSKIPNAPADGREFLRVLGDGMAADAARKNGSVISSTEVSLAGQPGREVRLEFPQSFLLSRIYAVNDRVYQLAAVLKKEPQAWETAAKTLDTFKVLTPADVEAALRKQVAEATPSPLPQEPVVKRPKSDAEDEGLKGRVKTVFTEDEDLSGTWSVQGRKPSAMEYYNEQGNLTKRESYDYKGNPSDITVYGYLDGERASHSKSIEHEYNPPPMLVASAPGEPKPKYDPRYSFKFKFRYDDRGRLLEKDWYGNSGKLWLRYVYKYDGNKKEELVYSEDGSLNQKYLYVLDDKGNEIEETIYETRDDSVRSRYAYAYEFDAHGNWVKRTTSKWVTKGGQPALEPYSVYYRTITYYGDSAK